METYLLKGDISGIQEYIFNVSSKGAAKALHKNSLVIMKMEEKYKNTLKDKLCISDAEIVKGGGGFHMIIEKSGGIDIEQRLNDFQLEINSELKHWPFSVRLSYGSEDTFGKAWKDLRKNNNDKRYRLYQGIDDNLFTELFEPFKKESESFFENTLEAISVGAVENQHWTKELLESIKKSDLNKEHKKLIEEFKKNSQYDMPFIDFDGYALFAKARTGTDFLGVLKMDVDNLGELFGKCNSIDEFKNKSNFFNEFFGKENIEKLLNKSWIEKWTYHQNIYTVYTGGDDCFFIGSWDSILDFVKVFHDEFVEQVKTKLKKDDKITLSAGIVLLDAKTPVVQLGRMAEEALSKAKQRKEEKGIVKNAVCLMNEIFTWDDYNGIMKQTKTLTEFLENKKITRGLLEKIKKSSIGFDRLQQRIKRGEPLPFDRLYKLKYYLRDVKKEYVDEVELEIFKPYTEALTKILTNQSQVFSKRYINPMRFPMAARLSEFKKPKNNNNE